MENIEIKRVTGVHREMMMVVMMVIMIGEYGEDDGVDQDRLEAQLHQFSTERERLVGESREDKEEMAQKQKESEDYLNDVQIALDQNHSEVEVILKPSTF